MFERKKLVYDTSFYSELVGERYLSIKGGTMEKALSHLETAFTSTGDQGDALSFTQELFGTLIDGEGVAETQNQAQWAKACFEVLEGSSDWKALQRQCFRKRELSAIVSAGLINELADVLAEVREQNGDRS